MKLLISLTLLFTTLHQTLACSGHRSPAARRIPNTFLGTIEQGCSPGEIASVGQLILDSSKCYLPLGPPGCNLCKLRIYVPQTTNSIFTVQALAGEFSRAATPRVEGTKCRCSEGCYFHQSSVSAEPGSSHPTFSEPFACYSGISTRNPQLDTYLIWCESDGGCPNSVVARYHYFIRFELLSANRPATKSVVTAKIASLPGYKCRAEGMTENVRNYIRGNSDNPTTGGLGPKPGRSPRPRRSPKPSKIPKASKSPRASKSPKPSSNATPSKSPKPQKGQECDACRNARNCESKICYKKKCLLSNSEQDKANCGVGAPTCDEDERVSRCINTCIRSYQ